MTIRMLTGWSVDTISAFAEGVFLRDYDFVEHQDVGPDYIPDDWNSNSKLQIDTFKMSLRN